MLYTKIGYIVSFLNKNILILIKFNVLELVVKF